MLCRLIELVSYIIMLAADVYIALYIPEIKLIRYNLILSALHFVIELYLASTAQLIVRYICIFIIIYYTYHCLGFC
jgi:hypothetical protein